MLNIRRPCFNHTHTYISHNHITMYDTTDNIVLFNVIYRITNIDNIELHTHTHIIMMMMMMMMMILIDSGKKIIIR